MDGSFFYEYLSARAILRGFFKTYLRMITANCAPQSADKESLHSDQGILTHQWIFNIFSVEGAEFES